MWIGALFHELGHVWGSGALRRGTHTGPRLAVGAHERSRWLHGRLCRDLRPFGATIAVTVSGDNLRSAAFKKILAGPIASFVLFVVLGFGSYELWIRTDRQTAEQSRGKLFLGGFALVTLVEGVVNLVPHKTEEYANDGYQLLGLMRSDPLMKAGMNISLLLGSTEAARATTGS